jgi:lipopolysaccharide export system protein LptA
MVNRLLRLWYFKIIFLFPLLHAQENALLQKENAMIVNSGEAQYNGREIILTGQVIVQHDLGQISARCLSVQPSSNKDKKSKFGFLKINDNVQIELAEGGMLYCQQAEVDYANMQGFFLGNAEWPDVTYLNTGEGRKSGLLLDSSNSSISGCVKSLNHGSFHANQKSGNLMNRAVEARPPFELRSSQMMLELVREPQTTSTVAKILVKQIEANHNVRVRYNQDHLLLADHALYQRLPSALSSSIAGILTLTVRGNLPACKMTNLNGDRLSAQVIQLNTIERKLWLTQPKGMLYMRREERPVQTLEFSANELLWDDQQRTLQLKGEVNITQNGTLHVKTDHELLISQAIVNGKRVLERLQSPENTHIDYTDIQKGNTHQIYCPGFFSIDNERQEITLQGLQDSSRVNQLQVYIEDALGEMYADRVHIHYNWEEQQLVPGKTRLEGHVRLMNRFDGHLEETGSILHYALADLVEYFPKQQEMILTGANGNRVLFFDRVNNVQMSAPSLKVMHDTTTKKDAIQGVGDVRFTFVEKELDQLKQHFPLAESFQKEGKSAKSKKQ